MTLSDNERDTLIQYHLEQANEAVEDVKILLNHNRINASVSCIYYGMFYALSALALKHQFKTSKHGQLIGWFNKQFVHEGLVDATFGKMINRAYNRRLKGDYDPKVEFDKATVEQMYRDMKAFIEEVKALLSKN